MLAVVFLEDELPHVRFARAVQGRWIHVFIRERNGHRLYVTIYVLDKDAHTVDRYQLVDPDTGKKSAPARSVQLPWSIPSSISSGKEPVVLHLCLAWVALSKKRITELCASLDEHGHDPRLRKIAMDPRVAFEEGTADPDKSRYIRHRLTSNGRKEAGIFLRDHMNDLKLLREKYIERLDAYLRIISRDDFNSRSQLAYMVASLRSQARGQGIGFIAESLRNQALDADIKEFCNRPTKLRRDIENIAQEMTKRLNDPAIGAIHRDYTIDGDAGLAMKWIEWFALVQERLRESTAGQAYLGDEVDKSLLQNMDSNLIRLLKSVRTPDAVDAMLSSLVEYASFAGKKKGNDRGALLKSLNKPLSAHAGQTLVAKRGTSCLGGPSTHIEIRSNGSGKFLDAIGKSKLQLLIALWDFSEDLSEASDEKSGASERAHNLLGAASALANAITLLAPAIERGLGKGAAHRLPIIGMIGACMDIVGFSALTVEKIDSGDIDAAIASTAIVVGSALCVVATGVGMAKTGGVVASTVEGAPLGGVLALLGLIVSGVGYIMLEYATDTDLEQWLLHCEWGVEAGAHPSGALEVGGKTYDYSMWPGNYDVQIEALCAVLEEMKYG
ncbi:hypothetical protein [Sorangium sp. So ce388]|uniref:hypothetical protein n=1 Tax=Sorangium sp. So ce388 TaxID=3133309 RepID=UPI003F5BC44F